MAAHRSWCTLKENRRKTMGSLSDGLRNAGLITQRQFEVEQTQASRREGKKVKKMIKEFSPDPEYNSLREFLRDASRRLSENYSDHLMGQIIYEAHRVADKLNLDKRHRGGMHAFLARMQEALRGVDDEERPAFICRQFRKFDPNEVKSH